MASIQPRLDTSSGLAHWRFVDPPTALDELGVRASSADPRSSRGAAVQCTGDIEIVQRNRNASVHPSEVFADRAPRGGKAVPRTPTPFKMTPD